jgi:cysteine desulfurase / selenocysteine lyase
MSLIPSLLQSEERRLAEFPVARESVFMAHAGVTILPQRVTTAMQEYLHGACLAHQEYPAAWRALNETRALAAKLIGAKASEIGLIGPTSVGLNLVANGLSWQPGDEVVCYLDDYPANVYPWQNLARQGVTVRYLQPAVLGGITPELVEAALTPKTKLVALASCHFLTGNRIDLPAIGKLLRERGVLFCLDAIQTVGAFSTLVEHCDFLSADSHKWMLGPMAAGIFWVREELHDRVRPTLLGSWNVQSPQFVAQQSIAFEVGGRRWEPGALNMVGTLGMKAGIELLLEAGVDAISDRLLVLRNSLAEQLTALGFRTAELAPGCLPCGICSVTRDDDVDMGKLFQHLADHKVSASYRHDRSGRGYLRFSPHFYNTEAEIQKIASILSAAL